jgi:predicted anti-sigma-YlaC factor YlaD
MTDEPFSRTSDEDRRKIKAIDPLLNTAHSLAYVTKGIGEVLLVKPKIIGKCAHCRTISERMAVLKWEEVLAENQSEIRLYCCANRDCFRAVATKIMDRARAEIEPSGYFPPVKKTGIGIACPAPGR